MPETEKKELSRQEANKKIVEFLVVAVENHPQWRFHQILQNYNIVKPNKDQWYEESTATLEGIHL